MSQVRSNEEHDYALDALNLAIQKGHAQIVATMLNDLSPFNVSAPNGDDDADSDASDDGASYFIHTAAFHARDEVFCLLLNDFNASPTLQTDGGENAHILACALPNRKEKRAKVVKALLAVSDVVSAIDSQAERTYGGMEGCTALHLAAMNALPGCCIALCEAGADVNVRNAAGKTAYDLSSRKRPQIRELLVSFGTSMSSDLGESSDDYDSSADEEEYDADVEDQMDFLVITK